MAQSSTSSKTRKRAHREANKGLVKDPATTVARTDTPEWRVVPERMESFIPDDEVVEEDEVEKVDGTQLELDFGPQEAPKRNWLEAFKWLDGRGDS